MKSTALLAVSLLAPAALAAQQSSVAPFRAPIDAYRRAHEPEILREFRELLAIPNLASDSANIRRNAA